MNGWLWSVYLFLIVLVCYGRDYHVPRLTLLPENEMKIDWKLDNVVVKLLSNTSESVNV